MTWTTYRRALPGDGHAPPPPIPIDGRLTPPAPGEILFRLMPGRIIQLAAHAADLAPCIEAGGARLLFGHDEDFGGALIAPAGGGSDEDAAAPVRLGRGDGSCWLLAFDGLPRTPVRTDAGVTADPPAADAMIDLRRLAVLPISRAIRGGWGGLVFPLPAGFYRPRKAGGRRLPAFNYRSNRRAAA